MIEKVQQLSNDGEAKEINECARSVESKPGAFQIEDKISDKSAQQTSFF